MFEAGAFSTDPADPLRADAERLMHLKADDVAHGFQSMVGNRLVGVEGRAELLSGSGRGGRGKAGSVRARRSRAAGRALRSSRGAGRGRAARGAAHPRSPARTSRGDLAEPPHARRRAARRHLAPSGDQARRRDERPGADPQALAVAVLFADRAAAMVGHRGDRYRRPHGFGRIPQWRVVRGFRRAAPARSRRGDPSKPGRLRAGGRMARAHRRAARRDRGADPRAARAHHRRISARARARRRHLGGGRRLAREKRPDGSPPIAVASDGTVF